MSLSARQLRAIEYTERACSILSLLGSSFVITTFLWSRHFHTPINRLIFYASWGNTFASVATVISISGISHGVDSPLCQFQGFFMQWFVLLMMISYVCVLTKKDQVYTSRCALGLLHGLQCLPDPVSPIQYFSAEKA